MIAAEILIAPRSTDASATPSVAGAATASPTASASGFSDVLAAEIGPNAAAMPEAAPAIGAVSQGAEGDATPATPTADVIASLALLTTGTVGAQNGGAQAAAVDAAVVVATQTTGAPLQDMPTADAQTEPGPSTPLPAPLNIQTSVTPQAAPPATDPPVTTTMPDPADAVPAAQIPVPVVDGTNAAPVGQGAPLVPGDADAQAIDAAPAVPGVTTPAETAADETDTETAQVDPEPTQAPDGTAVPVVAAAVPQPLPPLATLIQPLVAAQTGDAETATDDATAVDAGGSKPRLRGMAGALAQMPAAKTQARDMSGDIIGDATLTEVAETKAAKVEHLTAPQDHLADTTETATAAPQAPVDPRSSLAQPLTAAAPRGPEAQGQAQPPLDVSQSGWEATLADRISTRMTDLGQEVEITLNPDSLGSVRIRLELSDKSAQVQILTDTPQAAQMFQQAEGRLADALNKAGLTLASHDATSRDASGRDGGAQNQNRDQNRGGNSGGFAGNARADAALAGLRGQNSPSATGGRSGANLVNIVA